MLQVTAYAVELLRCLDIVRGLVEQQPTAQVVEAVSLVSQLNSTLTAQLAHEAIKAGGILLGNVGNAGALAYLVDSLQRRKRSMSHLR